MPTIEQKQGVRFCRSCGVDMHLKRGKEYCSKPCWKKDAENRQKRKFHSYFNIDKNGCWLWTASKNEKGYGYYKINDKTISAHRAAYYFFVGVIPDGAHVCHKCDNPSCVNPDHLFISDAQGNAKDRHDKGRYAANRKPLDKGRFWEDGHEVNRFLVDAEFDF